MKARRCLPVILLALRPIAHNSCITANEASSGYVFVCAEASVQRRVGKRKQSKLNLCASIKCHCLLSKQIGGKRLLTIASTVCLSVHWDDSQQWLKVDFSPETHLAIRTMPTRCLFANAYTHKQTISSRWTISLFEQLQLHLSTHTHTPTGQRLPIDCEWNGQRNGASEAQMDTNRWMDESLNFAFLMSRKTSMFAIEIAHYWRGWSWVWIQISRMSASSRLARNHLKMALPM